MIEGINSVIDSAKFTKNLLDKFIVKTSSSIGISGFVFDILQDENISLTAEITDHFVEDNSVIQDHISLKPIRVSLRGFVGELTDIVDSRTSVVKPVIEKLQEIPGFLPSFTEAQEKVNETLESLGIQNAVDTGLSVSENLYSFFKNTIISESKQAAAYQYFKALWSSRQLITVETPWEYFRNMAIENVSTSIDQNTRFISDISLTFKQVRMADTLTTEFDESRFVKTNFAGRGKGQRGVVEDKGKTKGKRVSVLLQGIREGGDLFGIGG